MRVKIKLKKEFKEGTLLFCCQHFREKGHALPLWKGNILLAGIHMKGSNFVLISTTTPPISNWILKEKLMLEDN